MPPAVANWCTEVVDAIPFPIIRRERVGKTLKRDGPTVRESEAPKFAREFGGEEQTVRRCILAAKQHRGLTPFLVVAGRDR